jgi:hypothetical protein
MDLFGASSSRAEGDRCENHAFVSIFGASVHSLVAVLTKWWW